MEHVRTNWLQKAVAIVAGVVLAACLAVGFTPEKAWADEVTGVTIGEVQAPVAGQSVTAPTTTVTLTPDIPGATFTWQWLESGSPVTTSTFEAGHGYVAELTITLPAGNTFKANGISFDGSLSWPNTTGSALVRSSGTVLDISSDWFKVPLGAMVIYPNGQTWTKGSTQGLSFRYSAGQGYDGDVILVDGDDTLKKDVDFTFSGDTVTLKPEFLDTLSSGAHKVTLQVMTYITGRDEWVNGTFTIKDTAADDSSHYKMISGDGATWVKGSKTGLTFVSEAPFDELCRDSIVVNDEQLDSKYWTAEAGSTKITLSAEYLETLEPKDGYRLAFSSTNGISMATFNVKAAGEAAATTTTNTTTTSPQTGAETTPLAVTAFVFAMCALAAGAYLFRIRKHNMK